MEKGDGVRAWRFLRHVPEYEAAWRARAGAPTPSGGDPGREPGEPGPAPGSGPAPAPDVFRGQAHEPGGQATASGPGRGFPVRIQTRADLEAARFDLLAWADPRAEDGPASPFWVQDDMPEAAVSPAAEPLAGVVAAGGGALEALRLLDGNMVLKIEHEEAALQILLRDAGPFPAGAGIELCHAFGLRMPHSMRRLLDFWQVAGRPPPPRNGRSRRSATSRS